MCIVMVFFGAAIRQAAMKRTLDREGDALYFRLDDSPIVESEKVRPVVVLDF